jgi:hypothetical protein
MKNLCLAVTLAVAAFAPAAALADAPGRHPAYIHAIEDLRHARALLERPAGLQVKWDEQVAVREIDAALHEIKAAAIDDGKPLTEHPAIDVHLGWGGRLHRAAELVAKAHQDASGEEDNGEIRGLRKRALLHIDKASEYIAAGIQDSEAAPPPPPPPPPAAHPAYVHALENLRYARALLERPARATVKFDEAQAIRLIDGAIKEVKEAAVEDGKSLAEHPPIDVSLDYGGRLQKADELLMAARQDIDQREDNDFSKGLKHRALNRIDTAHNFVQQGIAAAHPPDAHPAYLHAMQDLRVARALLARPQHHKGAEVKWDEQTAIREIEKGMKEIKEAAIDDGKNLDDHPPVDMDVEWGGRMQKSLELVDGAIRDITQREDNGFSNGLRDRAIRHLSAARDFIKAGIENAHPR